METNEDGNQKAGKTCFVISPIGAAGSVTRHRADQVFEFLIRPVVEERGYQPVRADHVATPGIITNQIIDLVTDAELVVADLTDANANVFYELAVRHVTQRPLVQLIQEGQEIPFDVTVMRTISYDMTDPFKIGARKLDLAKAVDAAATGDPIETPISSAVELKQRRTSGDKFERALADVQTELAELRAELRSRSPQYFGGAYVGGEPLISVPLNNVNYQGVARTMADTARKFDEVVNLYRYTEPPTKRDGSENHEDETKG
jgi:hypothetical protein